MPEEVPALLSAEAVITGYGKKQVLKGVTVEVVPSEIVAVIGHNGAGKSTLLKVLFGLLPLWQGRICFAGQPNISPNPRSWRRRGVVYVPQGNSVFPNFTVRENLEMGSIVSANPQLIKEEFERVLTIFPVLKSRWERQAATLSGGEKQMLALATALLPSPRLLLLDEPSLGLAPPTQAQAFGCIQQINRDAGVAVLIVEQKVREVLKIAHRVYVLRNGTVSFSGPTALLDDTRLRQVYL